MEKEGIQTVNQLTNATGYDENSYVVNADTFANPHAIKLEYQKEQAEEHASRPGATVQSSSPTATDTKSTNAPAGPPLV